MRKYKERYEKEGKLAKIFMLTTRAIEEYPEHMVVLVFLNHEISYKVGN